MTKDALLLIDIQNDFCPLGKLAVEGGDDIVPLANRLQQRFDLVVATQDWHPADHSSFASQHPGKGPFETTEMPYGTQVLWPDHCIQGSKGAAFHSDLDMTRAAMIIRKGYRREIDSYSAFFENDHSTQTGLAGFLHDHGVERVTLCGLATDFCVYYSAVDAITCGFEAVLIEEACRAIDLNGSLAAARADMHERGVEFAAMTS